MLSVIWILAPLINIQAYLTLLHFADTVFFTNLSFVTILHWYHFSNNICSSLSNFDNFPNISNFSLLLPVLWWPVISYLQYFYYICLTTPQWSPHKMADLIAEMKTKILEYYINFFDKSVAGFERTDSNFERSSTVGKMSWNNFACYIGII